jgi:hypothetical protein
MAVWYEAVDGDKHRSFTLAYDDESVAKRFLSSGGKTAERYDSASDETLFIEFVRRIEVSVVCVVGAKIIKFLRLRNLLILNFSYILEQESHQHLMLH